MVSFFFAQSVKCVVNLLLSTEKTIIPVRIEFTSWCPKVQ